MSTPIGGERSQYVLVLTLDTLNGGGSRLGDGGAV